MVEVYCFVLLLLKLCFNLNHVANISAQILQEVAEVTFLLKEIYMFRFF